jgi:pimeloyl-ACP methyl ester carboxylesterase
LPDFDFKGLRASYRTWGEEPPVMLLHGGGASGSLWEKVAAALGDRERLIAPDLLNCGATASWPERGALSHDLQAELVARLIDEQGGGSMDVVGHSYGGATAVRLAVNRPDMSGRWC